MQVRVWMSDRIPDPALKSAVDAVVESWDDATADAWSAVQESYDAALAPLPLED